MTPEQIRNFLASEEFWPDIDGDKSSDMAWHEWCQPRYKKQREAWLKEQHQKSVLFVSRNL